MSPRTPGSRFPGFTGTLSAGTSPVDVAAALVPVAVAAPLFNASLTFVFIFVSPPNALSNWSETLGPAPLPVPLSKSETGDTYLAHGSVENTETWYVEPRQAVPPGGVGGGEDGGGLSPPP